MKVIASSSPFGSRARTSSLLVLRLLTESYAREIAPISELSLSSVQKGLQSLERDGLVAARLVGRTRLYRVAPRAYARRELESYLDRLLAIEEGLRSRAQRMRRRPRVTGKPL